ncbi:GGDEF domain-containing protein [Methylogaea oryzae]|uniref:GGDEF domain-containing protein n=1 Tax=Methylogaea oryzae TaxID=1295382 RepID=UPI00138F5605|nr:GGDEF domain-containing protein [Methylogaea oryzae]
MSFPRRSKYAELTPTPAKAATPVDLSSALQTTLITDQLVPLFFDLVAPIGLLDGFEYSLPRLNMRLSGGHAGTYRASYNLLLEGESLGEFTASRQYPHADFELKQLEGLLTQLIYPLRNTLLYHQALVDAHTDSLTGVGNRAALQSGLAREWKVACRQFAPLSLIAVDLDHFKQVNDAHGHPCGDQVLITVTQCIKHVVRGSDLVYRYGGEEFMILAPDTATEGAATLAERIRHQVEIMPCPTEQGDVNVTVSVGVATLASGESERHLVARADQALYQAKNEGRNRVVLAK